MRDAKQQAFPKVFLSVRLGDHFGAKYIVTKLPIPIETMGCHGHIIFTCSGSPGHKVIKLFSVSAQLSMKFQLLINVEIIKISGKFRFKTQKLVIYPANKC